VLILQYIAQTYEQYSHDEAKAFTNIKTKIAFATEDLQDAEYVSKLLGTRTVRMVGSSESLQSQGYTQSKNFHYQAAPLLRSDEIMKLPVKLILIIRTGHAPVKAKQMIWYHNTFMKDLMYDQTQIPHQVLHQQPFIHSVKLVNPDNI